MKVIYLGYGCVRATQLGNDLVLKCYDGYNPISCELVKGNPIKKINSEILENDE